jgi:hypothetical protein
LAAQRAQHATAHTYQDSEGPDSQELERPSDSTDGLLAHPETTIPPPEVALFLIEIYFSHWNAVLLFHKPSFTSDYLCNKVPDFVSLSVFALASMYDSSPVTCTGNAKIFLAFYVKRHSVLTRILSSRPSPVYRRRIAVNMHMNGQEPQVGSSCQGRANLPSRIFKRVKIWHSTGSLEAIRSEHIFIHVGLN